VTISRALERIGAETILVVDEDDRMRELARTLLLESGYSVIQAASGAEALRVSRLHRGRIDLLLTDVVIPSMDGPELANRVANLRSETRVLFMSGAEAEALCPSGLRLLGKPFSRDELQRQVREAIDGDPIGNAG
jgi:CheY-like chemotaxis protein